MFFSILFFSFFGNLFLVHLARMDFLFEKVGLFLILTAKITYIIYIRHTMMSIPKTTMEKTIMNNQYCKRLIPTNEGQKKVTATFLSAPMELLKICYGNITDAVVLNSLIFSVTNPKSKTYHETIDGKEVYTVTYGNLSSYLGLGLQDVVKALSILEFYGFIKLYDEGTIQKYPYSKGYSIDLDKIKKLSGKDFRNYA